MSVPKQYRQWTMKSLAHPLGPPSMAPPPATAIAVEISCMLVYPTTPCAAHPLLSILGYLVAHHGELKVPNVLYGVPGGARGSTLLWATFDYWEMGASG